MNGFFDFKNLSKGQREQIAQAFRNQQGNTPERMALMDIMDQFNGFLFEALTAVQDRANKKGVISSVFQVSCDYDPKAEPERFIKDGWGAQADIWPLIETVSTYQLTMLSMLEKFRTPENGPLRLASIGSGPGIYETFFARLLQSSSMGSKITCIDLAPQMAEMNHFIASLNPPFLRNLEILTADMAALPLADGSVDVVFCNNSLQWSKKWRTAIREMARVLDRKSLGALYLVIHTHKQEMHMRTLDGERIIDMEPVLVDEVLDELEKNSFSIQNSRQIRGGYGSGQMGGQLDRAFITARFMPGGIETSWRKAKVTVQGASMFRIDR